MNDLIHKTISGVDKKTIDHFNAVSNLVNLIEDAYPGEMTGDDRKMLEVYIGRIVTAVATNQIDPFSGVNDIDQALRLAEAGVPDFLDLIE
ncbi:hypothetical protein [Asticcacaulis sp.]|jgi:hypothetical protein|uniref:hypothetical protein n=1 Tax=Asticcacaulis sp. TaxID=1872648 RepID=UPI002C0B3484|nr:hypothetical protein [Asticcacaulis sp.]HTM79776.1 hypothetical protein [Asticcacaulis sp.]